MMCARGGVACVCPRGLGCGRDPPSHLVRPNPWRPPLHPSVLRVRDACCAHLRPFPSAASGGPLGQPSGPGATPSATSGGPVGQPSGSTAPPFRGWRSQPLCPRSTLQLPIIGVSKPSHQPIRNETFRIGNSRRLLIKRAFEEVGTRRKKGKGVNPPSGTRRGRPRNDATAEAERFSL